MKKDDTLWKSILEDIFDDFLLFFNPDAGAVFDFSRNFEYLDKELDHLFPPDDHSQHIRFVDKLVKVHCKNGDTEWVLVHIEVQGYNDPHFARRMFTYYSRILDKYNQPITAFAIFTDSKKAFRPCEYHREFMGTSLTYRFNAFKIIDQDEETLRKSENPFALVILTVKLALKRKKINENQLLDLNIDLAKNLLERNFPKHKIRKIMVFLSFYVRFERNETTVKFDNVLDKLLLRSDTMGIEEFIRERLKKEGRHEKSMEVIRKLLADKKYSIEEIAKVVGEPIDMIRKISLGHK